MIDVLIASQIYIMEGDKLQSLKERLAAKIKTKVELRKQGEDQPNEHIRQEAHINAQDDLNGQIGHEQDPYERMRQQNLNGQQELNRQQNLNEHRKAAISQGDLYEDEMEEEDQFIRQNPNEGLDQSDQSQEKDEEERKKSTSDRQIKLKIADLTEKSKQVIEKGEIPKIDPEEKKEKEAWLRPNVEPFVIHNLTVNDGEDEIRKQIDNMLSQKQEAEEEQDENLKYQQLMMNTIRNKRKVRAPRPLEKPTPINDYSPPYQEIKKFAAYLPQFVARRNRQAFGNFVDLGVRTLHEVVVQCYFSGLIRKDIMQSIKSISVDKQLEFINRFVNNKLQLYDFEKVKFTPLDYRRLCNLLLCHNKNKYIMKDRIYNVFKEITDFYESIYELSDDEYDKLSFSIWKKYNLGWWDDIENAKNNVYALPDDFDTSSYHHLKESPLFEADINNPEKGFYKAKALKYPSKVKTPNRKGAAEVIKGFQDPDSSMVRSSGTNIKDISSVQEKYPSIPEASHESENSSVQDSSSKRPSFNDSQSEDFSSGMGSRSRSRNALQRTRKRSVGGKSHDESRGLVSSINSSKLDDDGMEPSESSDQSSIPESLSISSLQKRRKGAGKIKGRKRRPAKNSSDSESGSMQKNDVFMESSESSGEANPRKRSHRRKK